MHSIVTGPGKCKFVYREPRKWEVMGTWNVVNNELQTEYIVEGQYFDNNFWRYGAFETGPWSKFSKFPFGAIFHLARTTDEKTPLVRYLEKVTAS